MVRKWLGKAYGQEAVQAIWRHFPEILRVVRVIQANIQAQFDYAPQPYPGPLTLLRTSYAYGENGKSSHLGWRAWAQGGVDIYRVPGNHLSLLRKPNVQVLADQLRRCLLAAAQDARVVKSTEDQAMSVINAMATHP